MRKLKTGNPWQSGLIATTVLTVSAFIGSLLWQVGYAQWAFVLAFLTVWLLISLFWSNDGFNEESDMILAEVMDFNVDHLLQRIEDLEKELKSLRQQLESPNPAQVKPVRQAAVNIKASKAG